MGQLGCHSGVAAAAGGSSQAEPGAREARMPSLPSRRAGDGAPSPLLLHPDAAGRGGELPGLPSHQGALGDERHCRNDTVWGADAAGEDVDRAAFLSSSSREALVPRSQCCHSHVDVLGDPTPWNWAKHLQTPLQITAVGRGSDCTAVEPERLVRDRQDMHQCPPRWTRDTQDMQDKVPWPSWLHPAAPMDIPGGANPVPCAQPCSCTGRGS